jgi:aryl-alcohol dehydrogenase-like predicted oxidoreductase
MQTVDLGNGGSKVFVVGLGCMAMSGMYGPADDAESIATIHAALEQGITLLDTGDFYGMDHNELLLVSALQKIAAEKGATAAQLAVAWVCSRSKDIVLLIGARKRSQLTESLRALALELDAGDLARIETAVPQDRVAGMRYDAAQMSHLDSENPEDVGPVTGAQCRWTAERRLR